MLELRYFVKGLFLPPFTQLLLMLAAWMLWRKYPRLAKVCLATGFISLWLLSTPYISSNLMRSVERVPPLEVEKLSEIDAGAIVVLTGGRNSSSIEFGHSVSFSNGLVRLRYAAFVHRKTALPLLLTGGVLEEDWEHSLAEVMQFELKNIFNLQARWLESESQTTYENALYSYQLLSKENIQKIILITEASHMLRSKYLFEQAGFVVIPAPTGYSLRYPFSFINIMPSTRGIYDSAKALHEWMGYFYYRLRNVF